MSEFDLDIRVNNTVEIASDLELDTYKAISDCLKTCKVFC